MRFRDRIQAGDLLGERLRSLGLKDAIVLALPRGGVPVAARVARKMGVPFDVFVSRKIGAPHRPELGVGAVAEGGMLWFDKRSAASVGLDDDGVERAAERERVEVVRRVQMYRKGRPLPDLRHRPVVLVDDGIATGGTVHAAIQALRALGVDHLVLAVPVAPPSTLGELAEHVEEIVCLSEPKDLWAIGAWYDDFKQVDDDEVLALLDAVHSPAVSREIVIPTRDAGLEGTLTLPAGAPGIVVFAHGSGSSRFSPRNRFVARHLSDAGLGTLLFDLLTSDEEAVDAIDASLRFDIELLTGRLVEAMDWLSSTVQPQGQRLGLFGSSTGAAAALAAAARRPASVAAVVSRGGRPDLAQASLAMVQAPVLLIVGGLDLDVLALNRQAAVMLPRSPRIEIIGGATHLFPEPGKLEAAAQVARAFFVEHLGSTATREAPI